MKSYREELLELHHRRVYYILLAGATFMVLFSVLDYFVVPEMFVEFLLCRLAGTAICLLFVFLNYRDQQKKFAFATGFSGYIAISMVLLVIIARMEGIASPYYVGLILVMTLYAALAPLTMGQTLISGLLLVLLYTITVLYSTPLSEPFLLDLFANLFFMLSMVGLNTTQSWAHTRAREKEYTLRVEENRIAEQLSLHAEALEIEVEKRSREQQEREARYRLLFNQIADDVVLVSPEGIILQTNSNFDQHYGDDIHYGETPLSTIIPEEEQRNLRNILAETISSITPVRNRQLRLIKRDGNSTETEVSAGLLRRDQAVIVILMLIRDISGRKVMEQKLLASLETRKQTETAAILALAKLSEFRDATSSNHLERIREYCQLLAIELSQYPELQSVMTPTYIEDIYHASILHDIGKVAIPDKFGGLDEPQLEHEHELVRRHTITGGDVIREMQEESKGSSFLEMAKHIAYFHHERWDGRGYPHGLMRREIPLAARIMALADAYEEMTAGTPNNPTSKSHDETVSYITSQSGLRFDPMVVGAFLARQDDFQAILKRLMNA
ncbi:HD-GYP domain-containing protein [Desulfopila aestuarii]|uniref:PAS domain S-box-containing protein n=1 Tax=Desulfopila aestuarii DSM 18488 TaxID=1121416 RepID=A0A1M7Y9G2_9BACT|nr:HD domain-containing phosphohydrolase [Desulfopila aestuarii]SHO49239.1 PAS domain S-box-containing protein [Desulfopila aestuarii DSM 18488]